MLHKVIDVVRGLGQPHLLAGIESLSSSEQQSFLDQARKYGPGLAKRQKELISRREKQIFSEDVPLCNFERSGNLEDHLLGESLLRQGKVGCLILAGGQGTRLGFDGPKGAVPVTPVTGKSLFQLFCERTLAVGSNVGRKAASLHHDLRVESCADNRFF